MPSNKGLAALSDVQNELQLLCGCGSSGENNPARNSYCTVDKYLNSGSYGAVCAGVDKYGNPVAVKRVYTTVSDGRTVTILSDSFLGKRVLREIKLLSHFTHPNILSLRHVMINMNPPGKEKLYLFTDLMRTDLAQVIPDKAINITPAHIQYFMYNIMLGLHALHAAGVVHRDLHPGNILLSERNDVKICDFNLAREDIPGDDKTHYVTHRWYRAPELVMQFRNFTKKVDIWSAGCIMGELFNRKTLFRGSTFYNQLNRIIEIIGTPSGEDVMMFSSQSAREYLQATLSNYPAKPWNEVCPSASPVAIDLMSKMLVFNPNRRLTTEEALRHPYFADLFSEEDLLLNLAEPFHFPEHQINSVGEIHKMFIEIAETYAQREKENDSAFRAAQKNRLGNDNTVISGNNGNYRNNESASNISDSNVINNNSNPVQQPQQLASVATASSNNNNLGVFSPKPAAVILESGNDENKPGANHIPRTGSFLSLCD